MRSVSPAHHVAGILQHGMLKAAAGPEERPTLFAGKTNGSQGAFFILVGAAGDAPDTIEVIQQRIVDKPVGGQPLEANVVARLPAGQFKCEGDRSVSGDLRVMIADQGDVERTLFFHGGLAAC